MKRHRQTEKDEEKDEERQAQPVCNTFVETRTFVARQVPLPESPLQKLINQSWLAKKTEFYDFVSDLNDIGEDAGMRTLDEICRWMKHENPYTNSNGHEQSVHGVHGVQSVQNNGAQLVPVDQQNYDQFMIQQGYDDYPCIEPQLTNDDYIAEIKRVFRPDIGIGNQRYNCISINLAPGDVRYCLQLNLNQSLGQNCLTNKSRLEELLQHVPTKSFHSGSIGNEQCCYHSYCIAKIGQIALGIGLGPNKKVANQAAAKVVLEKVFQVDSFEVEC